MIHLPNEIDAALVENSNDGADIKPCNVLIAAFEAGPEIAAPFGGKVVFLPVAIDGRPPCCASLAAFRRKQRRLSPSLSK